MAGQTPEPVVISTLFYELPYCLDIDHVHVWTYASREPWRGWDQASMASYIGVPEPLPAGLTPSYRVAFRTSSSRAPSHVEALEAAFFDELTAARGLRKRLRRRVALAWRLWCGRPSLRTVIGVTHYSPAIEQALEQGRQAKQHLIAMNDFLTSLALITSNPLLGSLSSDELPADSPMMTMLPSTDGWVAQRQVLNVGVWHQHLLQRPRPAGDLQRAAYLGQCAVAENEPTFTVTALLHDSRRDLVAGRLTRAVTFSGIAVELLVQTTIERGWQRVGLDPARMPGALQSGFKNQLQDHLGRVLSLGRLDVHDASSALGQWWLRGYGLRDEVVHRGRRPSSDAAHDAVASALAFAAFCGKALEANPATRDLRGWLPTERVSAARYADITFNV